MSLPEENSLSEEGAKAGLQRQEQGPKDAGCVGLPGRAGEGELQKVRDTRLVFEIRSKTCSKP